MHFAHVQDENDKAFPVITTDISINGIKYAIQKRSAKVKPYYQLLWPASELQTSYASYISLEYKYQNKYHYNGILSLYQLVSLY